MANINLNLPILPTTSVGSFPKPDYLKLARRNFSSGKITYNELEKLEKKATEFWIKTQEELNFDILVDGEMYRGDMATYFAQNYKGFAISGFVRSYGNRYYQKPVIVSKLKWEKPVTLKWWKFAQSLTKKPIKGMLTGPYTMMDWSFNEYYPDRKSATIELAKVIRKEVEALADAGAKIIQIDEPAVSVRPDEIEFVIEAMHIITDGIPAYFITHICYGEFDRIYPEMLKIPVENFDLEMANSNYSLIERFKKNKFIKDLSAGVVDVHSHNIEDVEVVKERIKKLLQVIPKKQLWIDPDCGLKTRTVFEAIGKLKVISKAVKEFRKNN